MNFLRIMDRLLERTVAITGWLALPLVLLLFLQWPLRDLVHAHSRDANDLAQTIFAVYVAVSMTAATRANTHLAADTLAQNYSVRTRDVLKRMGSAIGLLPWALLLLIAGKNMVISSLIYFELFPDTANVGYFVIKLALWLLALTVLAQCLLDIFRPFRESGR